MVGKIRGCVSHLVDKQEPFVLVRNEEHTWFEEHSSEPIGYSRPQGSLSVGVLNYSPVADSVERGHGQSSA